MTQGKSQMNSVIDDTLVVLQSLGLNSVKVTTPPGYAGISVALPNNAQAFFVWSNMGKDDFQFRTARFWENDNPFSGFVCQDLIQAITQTRILIA